MSAEKKMEGGKKLVQARLPFKIITGASGSSSSEGDKVFVAAIESAMDIDAEVEICKDVKRKLSDISVQLAEVELSTHHSEIKENLSSKSKSLMADSEMEIILIDDDIEDTNVKPSSSIQKSDLAKKTGAGTPNKGQKKLLCKENSPKIQIKIPFTTGQGNKRKKSICQLLENEKPDLSAQEIDSSDEADVLNQSLHKKKRPKIGIGTIRSIKGEDAVVNAQSSAPLKSGINVSKTDCEKSTSDTQINKKENQKNSEKIIFDSSDSVETESEKDVAQSQENNSTLMTTVNKVVQKKHLTPKQLKLIEQRRKAREEKERLLLEEKRQKQQEKEAKELIRKKEREEREEQRRKEREEREEQKRIDREAKERKRLADLEAKSEEKRKRNEAKEEELRKKEEERRKREQEREEADLKAKKAAAAFQRFFKPKRVNNIAEDADKSVTYNGNENMINETLAFRPFEVKGDMKLAPVCRKRLSSDARKNLENIISISNTEENIDDTPKTRKLEEYPYSDLYLGELHNGKIIAHTWRQMRQGRNELNDDLMIIEDEFERVGQTIVEETHGTIERFRAKFLKFWENRRPPYFGTWRKKTSIIKFRRPFAQDKKYFDYDVDSDLEWEEEEPGESLDGSDDDKEKESEDDEYEVDNEWFVPHGHLSEEELQNEDDTDVNTREVQKAKLQILQQEFVHEMKQKTEKIKPRLIGCIWADENGNQPSVCPKIIWDTLNLHNMLYAMVPLVEEIEMSDKPDTISLCVNSIEKCNEKLKPITLNERMLKDLIRLVHGNRHSKNFLIKEFIAYLEANEDCIKNGDVRGPLKSVVREKIEKYAEWQIIDTKNNNDMQQKKKTKRLCWVVTDNVLQQMGLHGISLHNNWQYTLQPKIVKNYKPSQDILASDEGRDYICDNISLLKDNADLSSPNCTKRSTGNKANVNGNGPMISPMNIEKQIDDEKTQNPCHEKITSHIHTTKKHIPTILPVARGKKISPTNKHKFVSEYLKRNSKQSKTKETIVGIGKNISEDVIALD